MPKLSERQRDALQIVWDLFIENEAWPRFATVDKAIYRGLDTGLLELLGSQPAWISVDRFGQPGSTVSLTLAGVDNCDSSKRELENLLAALDWCVAFERNHDQPTPDVGDAFQIASGELARGLELAGRPLTRPELNRVFALLQSEGMTSGSNGPAPDDRNQWTISIDRHIRRFATITSVSELLAFTVRDAPSQLAPSVPLQALAHRRQGTPPSAPLQVASPRPQHRLRTWCGLRTFTQKLGLATLFVALFAALPGWLALRGDGDSPHDDCKVIINGSYNSVAGGCPRGTSIVPPIATPRSSP